MIYVRTISIFRPVSVTSDSQGDLQEGLLSYQGLDPSVEPLIFTGIPCSIQAEALGNIRNATSERPSDAPGPVKWSIYVPKTALNLGDVRTSDLIVDDIADRYQVAFAYWNVLGYKIGVVRLRN